MTHFWATYKSTLLYAFLLSVLLFVLKWLEFRLLIIHHATELYMGVVALFFTALGIWLALKLTLPKQHSARTEATTTIPNFHETETTHSLSKRELEVLNLMAEGLSNQEIAARLFVSLNTIKTHSSRVFEKLDVKRRTQAIEKARRLRIIS
ncbi:response regulator transcription factor [Arundinibacter roseus]|uniref:Response regulator transcription factor n=1 Tax=Arundinibacter roseus TaxID=2070510 RepID=A0A4R4K1G6_9BACT|nr:response regulator transcription factor [Arundinibacter roseus]TDB61137.1 response regulator transcription factor [Arundinibacter roseus]